MPARIAATSSYSFKQLLNFPHKVWVESRHSNQSTKLKGPNPVSIAYTTTHSNFQCYSSLVLNPGGFFSAKPGSPGTKASMLDTYSTTVTAWNYIKNYMTIFIWMYRTILHGKLECFDHIFSQHFQIWDTKRISKKLYEETIKKFSFQGTVEQLSGDWIFNYTAFSTEEEGGDNEEKKKKM